MKEQNKRTKKIMTYIKCPSKNGRIRFELVGRLRKKGGKPLEPSHPFKCVYINLQELQAGLRLIAVHSARLVLAAPSAPVQQPQVSH